MAVRAPDVTSLLNSVFVLVSTTGYAAEAIPVATAATAAPIPAKSAANGAVPAATVPAPAVAAFIPAVIAPIPAVTTPGFVVPALLPVLLRRPWHVMFLSYRLQLAFSWLVLQSLASKSLSDWWSTSAHW